MQTKDFYFDLPEELIAQTPSKVRGQDKLLVMDKFTGKVEHHKMEDLIDLIDEDTLMVFNNSKVRRSRCFAKKIQSEQAKKMNQQAPEKLVEFMILQNVPLQSLPSLANSDFTSAWRAMVKNAKKQKVGCQYIFQDGTIGTIVENKIDEGTEFRTVAFKKTLEETWFEQNGHIPLPPYIKREDNSEDSNRYQNVYAKEIGSAACPTAGLHFTQDMLHNLAMKGITQEYVTLHVGLGTFLPVRVDNIEDHKMHNEVFTITEETANAITKAKREGKKILAVGTTSVRTLESAWDEENQCLKAGTYSTNIFIYPGYKFKVVDKLFTNFHTPESTLMMLVSAFSDRCHIMSAYKEAIKENYRFFSYGDAMFIK